MNTIKVHTHTYELKVKTLLYYNFHLCIFSTHYNGTLLITIYNKYVCMHVAMYI